MLKSKMYLLVHTLTSHLIRYTLEIARRTLFPSELPYFYILCAIDIIICNHVMSFISHTTMTWVDAYFHIVQILTLPPVTSEIETLHTRQFFSNFGKL